MSTGKSTDVRSLDTQLMSSNKELESVFMFSTTASERDLRSTARVVRGGSDNVAWEFSRSRDPVPAVHEPMCNADTERSFVLQQIEVP